MSETVLENQTDSAYQPDLDVPTVEQQLRVTATQFVLQANVYDANFVTFLDQCRQVEQFLING